MKKCERCEARRNRIFSCVTCGKSLCGYCSFGSRAGRVCGGAGDCHQIALARHAHASLFEAAPDLLEAAMAASALLGPHDSALACGNDVRQQLETAIAKYQSVEHEACRQCGSHNGESGPKVRPSNPDWFRSVRDQCVAAGVPFFFKQWGGRTPKSGGRLLDGKVWDEMPRLQAIGASIPKSQRPFSEESW